MLQRLGSILFWAFLALSSIALFPVALLLWALTAPFDPRRVWLHRFTCFWASLYSWLNPAWPVTIEGRERLQPDETYVMVANHLSLLDILVLFRLFAHFKWVSKIENFRVPFIGWNMRLNRYVELRRGDRTSVEKMFVECERTLAAGNSLMMFPEGTRSPTGHMRDFKTGAFELAMRCRRPLLPIALRGTNHALPKRGFVLRGRHPIHITLLPPIPPEAFDTEDPRVLAERVRAALLAVVEPAGAAPEPGAEAVG